MDVSFGWPSKFVIQDQSRLPIGIPDGPAFPYDANILSPWEYPTSILFGVLLVDLVLWTLISIGAYVLLQKLSSMARREP